MSLGTFGDDLIFHETLQLLPDPHQALWITDAFTKYAVVTAIPNKNLETVADAIFKEWFYKFGIPAQIHTDGGKEFVNKLSAETMVLLNVAHTRLIKENPRRRGDISETIYL